MSDSPKYTEVQTNIEEQKQEYVTMLHKLVAKTADPRKTIWQYTYLARQYTNIVWVAPLLLLKG